MGSEDTLDPTNWHREQENNAIRKAATLATLRRVRERINALPSTGRWIYRVDIENMFDAMIAEEERK